MGIFGEIQFHYKQLKNKGIEIQMDGSALPDQIVYTPGDHTFTVIAGKEIYSKKKLVSVIRSKIR